VAYRRTPRDQARLDAQRTALLDAAQDVLAEGGYAACTVAGVAARADMATGSVYAHFATKSALLADVFRLAVGREVAAVRAAAERGDNATDRVAAVVETFAARALKQPARAYALLAEPVDPVVDALRLEFRVAYRDVLADAVRRGVQSGELPPQNAEVVAAALVGAIGESLIGPLAAARNRQAADPDTVPTLLAFTHRAIGGPDRAHP
jgi:AcrR family transcriptional regulator